MNTTSNYKAIITKLAINWQSCNKNYLPKFSFKKLDEKVFQVTLFAKSDIIKVSLKNVKVVQKDIAVKQDLVNQEAYILV